MITPRITRLLRVADLQAMHAYIAQCAASPEVRRCVVLVPTRGAAEALRQTLEDRCLTDRSPALILPDIVTRGEFYERLHARLSDAPPRLTEFEREVIFRRAAIDAASQGVPPPFRLRAGLIVEILAFYDELRRRDKGVPAFERLMVGSLESSAETDRGAERLLRLTNFLVAAFAIFEERVARSGRVDEHGLRTLLVGAGETAMSGSSAYQHVVVTVPDQAADPRGLWLADYDLLARMPGVRQLDIVATENVLASGYHQRVHDVLPGIDEERFGVAASAPALVVPDANTEGDSRRWVVSRDREEELAEVARRLKVAAGTPLGRTAVVFQRPLPYLYLARQVLADAEIPYQTLDALPLAAEPFAAAIDLVFSFLLAEGNRASLVELLASPHWSFEADGSRIGREDVAAADARLRELKYVGGWDRLASLAEHSTAEPLPDTRRRTPARSQATRAAAALRAAAAAAGELRPVTDGASASQQLSALLAFIAAHERLPEPDAPWYGPHLRARAAVTSLLELLRDAHRDYDDASGSAAGTCRLPSGDGSKAQTFSPRTGTRGLRLLDAPAAAYADVDELRLVGLVEVGLAGARRAAASSIRVAARRSSAGRRTRIGSPAARARFQDLLRLAAPARLGVHVHARRRRDRAGRRAFLEEVERAGCRSSAVPPRHGAARVFVHEALAERAGRAPARLAGAAREWLALRASRSPAPAAFHGAAGAARRRRSTPSAASSATSSARSSTSPRTC